MNLSLLCVDILDIMSTGNDGRRESSFVDIWKSLESELSLAAEAEAAEKAAADAAEKAAAEAAEKAAAEKAEAEAPAPAAAEAAAAEKEAAAADTLKLETVNLEPDIAISYFNTNANSPQPQFKFTLKLPEKLNELNIPIMNTNNVLVEGLNDCLKTYHVVLTQYVRYQDDNLPKCVILHLIVYKLASDGNIESESVPVAENYLGITYDSSTNLINSASLENSSTGLFIDESFSGVIPGVIPTTDESVSSSGRSSRRKTRLENELKNAYLLPAIIADLLRRQQDDNSNHQQNTPIGSRSYSSPVAKNNGVKETPGSLFSPVLNSGTFVKLPFESRIRELATHDISGLGEIAGQRVLTQIGSVNPFFNDTTIKSIKDQLDQLDQLGENTQLGEDTRSLVKCAQAINDTIDRAHDFIKDFNDVTNVTESMVNPPTLTAFVNNGTSLFSNSVGSGNINVVHSHKLQQKNVDDLVETLKKNNIVFPELPEDKFLSRKQVFAEFYADTLNKVSRRHYSESGKQVTRHTLAKYINELLNEGNGSEIQAFLTDVELRLNKEALVEVKTSKEDVIAEFHNDTTNLIKKNCYQQMDGCSTGDTEFTEELKEELKKSEITGLFGCLTVKLENEKCGEDSISTEVTVEDPSGNKLTVTIDGQITLDGVINTIHKYLKVDNYFPTRGSNQSTTGYSVEFNPESFQPREVDKPKKMLMMMCLKTFCDKLYTLSMSSDKGITHINTIDSYVYGDAQIRYLGGEFNYYPTIMRNAIATVDKDEESCSSTENIKIKGFWVRRGVGSSTSVGNPLNNLLMKTLGYMSFLTNIGITVSSLIDLTSIDPKVSRVIDSIKLRPNEISETTSLISSFRLQNFFERYLYIYESMCEASQRSQTEKPVNTGNIPVESDGTKLSYDMEMKKLLILEMCKVKKRLKDYVDKVNDMFGEILKESTDKEKVKKILIELPDLEDILTFSTPNLYIANQTTLLFQSDRTLNAQECPAELYSGNDIIVNTDNSNKVSTTNANEDSSSGITFKHNRVTFRVNGKLYNDKPIDLELLIDLYNMCKNDNDKTSIYTRIRDILEEFRILIGVNDDKVYDKECVVQFIQSTVRSGIDLFGVSGSVSGSDSGSVSKRRKLDNGSGGNTDESKNVDMGGDTATEEENKTPPQTPPQTPTGGSPQPSRRSVTRKGGKKSRGGTRRKKRTFQKHTRRRKKVKKRKRTRRKTRNK